MIKRFGWTRIALITPITMAVTAFGFFAFLFSKEFFGPFVSLAMGVTPLAGAVFFGGMQNCLSKSCKYSVFDATKEMSFIPLSHESKLKGKAAIDGVGSRFGKSGGSIIHQGLLMLFGSLPSSSPFVAGILAVVILFWISSTRTLGKLFVQLVSDQEVIAEIEPEESSKEEILQHV
jgi:ATP:ADP antiporter, AAA family